MELNNKFSRIGFLAIIFTSCLPWSSFAKTTDLGVCFLKAQKPTFQSKINEIAMSPQENVRMQQNVRFFNDLTSLFVPIDTYNYKLFWVTKPNNEWLTQNCFKFGYITQMDYNRRAITRVYSNPSNIDGGQVASQSRFPASTKAAVPQADPINTNIVSEDKDKFIPEVDPQESNNNQMINQAPAANGYATPQINLYNNYYSSGQPNPDTSAQKKSEDNSKKEDNLNVNVNVGDKEEKAKTTPVVDTKNKGSVYDLPSYLEQPSYFFELSPYMAYENANTLGSGNENKFNIFSYGADLKVGYRSNQHFNYYLKGRYASLESRSVEAPTALTLNENYDFTYGLGIEHVASRFLSIALEYNALHIQSFEQQIILTDVESVREDVQTMNLDFKINFISRDDYKFGLSGNYGIVLADNTDEIIYDLKTKLYTMRTFENGYFGLNFGFEQNRFSYASGNTSEVIRKRYVFGLNYGFDL